MQKNADFQVKFPLAEKLVHRWGLIAASGSVISWADPVKALS